MFCPGAWTKFANPTGFKMKNVIFFGLGVFILDTALKSSFDLIALSWPCKFLVQIPVLDFTFYSVFCHVFTGIR